MPAIVDALEPPATGRCGRRSTAASPLPRTRRAVLAAGGLLAVLGALPARAGPAEQADGGAWSALHDGAIVLFRHARAPGIGDPPGFELGRCSTQRNLDASGRVQARRLGEAFRRHAVAVGAVLSSAWCRTHETAELAFPGQVRDDASFNSFFDDDRPAPGQTRAALAVLRAWRGPGVLVVVTHQVNITALTGIVPATGEGVIVEATPAGLKTVGRLAPDER